MRKRDCDPNRETILVVEDADEVRRMICQILLQDGYNVLEASDGIEALRVTSAYCNNIHLVLTDVVMPRMDGRELAEQIRRTKPSTRMLFMSGYSDSMITNGSVAVFLAKPFTPVALMDKIRQVLDGPWQDPKDKTS